MKTVKTTRVLRTGELTGAALDWAVAKCDGRKDNDFGWWWDNYKPSTDWSQGGPIIEREVIETNRGGAYQHNFWCASVGHGNKRLYGPTPLIAAMRCYVASKLGDEVEVPEELTQ